MTPVIRSAGQDDRGAVAGALASAFSEDPLFRWMIDDDGPIEGRLLHLFSALVRQALRHSDNLVFVTDAGTGAALWQPIDRWKVPPLDLLRTMPGAIRAMRSRVPAMMGALSAIERHHPTEPHYYLEMLGTRAGQQGKGVGSALLATMLARCDAEGVPAYLESSNPRNIPFYGRHGFEVQRELAVGRGAPTVTAMWREPRG